MSETQQFVRVDFQRFKAFERFTIHLRHFNILVGPNNSGKSTILAAFRILSAALRKAWTRRPQIINMPDFVSYGYIIDLTAISVAEENIFYNYDDSEPASVIFTLSNRNTLKLYFPEIGTCNLIAESAGQLPRTPSEFRKYFNCPIGFVPILGPVEHNEQLYQQEAARLALFNYTAARNFRNIWHHYPEKFIEFRQTLKETWPGMDIEPPSVDYSHDKPRLHMFCPEERIPRELFWAGFGFQVWCQMLTHLVQSSDKALFLIDEPDIYLHSELQRQLLGLLRNLGLDILIATHSTEIITEAEADDIVLIDKKRNSARRIKHPAELVTVFAILGSNLNPILTQLAKTKRVIFVEGRDFQIIGKFAWKLKYTQVANRTEFAVVPVEGFNPERIRTLKKGMETTLGGKIASAAIFDRDFRSDAECEAITSACEGFCEVVWVLGCKEIENFLLSPYAIDCAAERKVADRARRTGTELIYYPCVQEILEAYADEKKTYVTSQYLASRRIFDSANSRRFNDATSNEVALREFEERWSNSDTRLAMIPGKDALSNVNFHLQERYGINVTPTTIIDAIQPDHIPTEMSNLIDALSAFAKTSPGSKKG